MSKVGEDENEGRVCYIETDVKTSKTTIWCIYTSDFSQEGSIGLLFRFKPKLFPFRETYVSGSTTNINKVNVIRILTNITTGVTYIVYI